MPNKFKDLFSGHATDYSTYRPGYPTELFQYIFSVSAGRDVAWDCATGNGQAARGLLPYFKQIVATDASDQQIANAYPHEKIQYHVATAYDSALQTGSVDTVTVAQALHWFDFPAFFTEADRVLKPRGILAVWCYMVPMITEEINPIIRRFWGEIVGPYWPPERKYVDEGYETIPFPYPLLHSPEFEARHYWDLDRFLGYLCTWSASKRYEQSTHTDPVRLIEPELRQVWNDPDQEKLIHWPIHLKAARKPSSGE